MNGINELLVVGENVPDVETLEQFVNETPPWARYSKPELLEKNIPHLLRIRKELWHLIKRD